MKGAGDGSWPFQCPQPGPRSVAFSLRHKWTWLLTGPLLQKGAGGKTKDKWGWIRVHRGCEAVSGSVARVMVDSLLPGSICLLATLLGWTHEGFATFYLDPKVPTKTPLSMNDCQVIVAKGGYVWDLLFHHLTDIEMFLFLLFLFYFNFFKSFGHATRHVGS